VAAQIEHLNLHAMVMRYALLIGDILTTKALLVEVTNHTQLKGRNNHLKTYRNTIHMQL
jgi:hypothetical protein